jgi:hypothetical protein
MTERYAFHHFNPGRAQAISFGNDPSSPLLAQLVYRALGEKLHRCRLYAVYQPQRSLAATRKCCGYVGRIFRLNRKVGSTYDFHFNLPFWLISRWTTLARIEANWLTQ